METLRRFAALLAASVVALVLAVDALALIWPGWVPPGYKRVTTFNQPQGYEYVYKKRGTELRIAVTYLSTQQSVARSCGTRGADRRFRSRGPLTKGRWIGWYHGNHGDDAIVCSSRAGSYRAVKFRAWTPHALGPAALARVVANMRPEGNLCTPGGC